MERDFKKDVIKFTRYGAGALLGVAGILTIFKNPILGGAEIIGAYFIWPKKESGAGAHASLHSSVGSQRALESSYSMARITQANAAA